MSQQQDIESAAPTGTPIVKFREIGQTLIGALVDAENRQQMKWKDGQTDGLAFKDDGKPAMERILYVLVMPGTTAMRSGGEGYEPLETKALARVILKGFKWGQYIDARNENPSLKGEKTGDIIRITYTHSSYTHRQTKARIELHTEADIAKVDRDIVIGKDMTITVERPGPHQAAVIDACNDARAERKAQPVGEAEAAPVVTAAAAGGIAGGRVDEAAFSRLTPLQRQAIINAQNDELPF